MKTFRVNKNRTTDLLNIVIYGAGSIGCYVGGHLALAGHRVQFIGRQPQKKLAEKYGLLLSDWHGNQYKIDNIDFSTVAGKALDADVIFVCVKNRDCQFAADTLSTIIKAKTVVVSLQNGVRAGDTFSNTLSKNLVLRGIVAFNVIQKSEGTFHCATEGNLLIEADSISHQLSQTLRVTGLRIDIRHNIQALQWSKLIMNLNNAINALCGIPLQQQLRNPGYRRVMANAIREALQVLKAANIKTMRIGKIIPELLPTILNLPTCLFIRIAKTMLNIDPQARSSMYDDLSHNRVTEIDYLNGEITQLAKQVGIPVPTNSHIVALIKAAEKANIGSPELSASDLLSPKP